MSWGGLQPVTPDRSMLRPGFEAVHENASVFFQDPRDYNRMMVRKTAKRFGPFYGFVMCEIPYHPIYILYQWREKVPRIEERKRRKRFMRHRGHNMENWEKYHKKQGNLKTILKKKKIRKDGGKEVG